MIDYAYYDRTDFLDIYLPANCKFFLGTPGGGGEYLSIFDKPRAVVNSIPIGLVPWTPNTIYIYKKVKHQKLGNTSLYTKLSKKIGLVLRILEKDF